MKSFEQCHPAVNFLFYISTVLFGVIFLHPVMLCISFFSAFAYQIKLTGKRAVKSLFCFFLPLMLFSVLINGLTAHYGVTPLFSLPNGNNVCLEPIVYGFVLGAAAVSVMMLFSCYQQTVSSDKLFFVLGGRLPQIALLLMMSLRFVPLYRQKLREIADAQKGIGAGAADGKFFDRIKNGGRMLSILLTWALENSVQTADSMKSRGYALPGRSHYNDYRFSAFDAGLLIFLAVCDAVVLFGAANGVTEVLYNPFFQIEKISGFSIFTYTVYAILFVTPLLLDCAEEIKWKRLP